MSKRDVISAAYNEFVENLFGEPLVDVSQRVVSRNDYTAAMKLVQKKYKLEEGHPKYLEWILTLIGRSPRFIDTTTKENGPVCPLPKEWRPEYPKDLMNKLTQPKMLELCGEWVLGVLRSTYFWNLLRRRIDMMSFALIQKMERTREDMIPYTLDSLSADALETLVDDDLKRIDKFTPMWLADELFRIIVVDQTEGLVVTENITYSYFIAPYFNTLLYDRPDWGQIVLDDLTEEVFREPLRLWINEIEQLMEEYHLRNPE